MGDPGQSWPSCSLSFCETVWNTVSQSTVTYKTTYWCGYIIYMHCLWYYVLCTDQIVLIYVSKIIPAGTCRRIDFVLTSMRRHHVASSLCNAILCLIVGLFSSRHKTFKTSFLYQHDIFYREDSLQDPHSSSIIVCDRDWPALKI